MNQAEYLGARLVMLIRREYEQREQLAKTEAEINDLYAQVQTMAAGEIYAGTGELPRVGPRVPDETPAERLYPRLVTSSPGDAVTEVMTAAPPTDVVRMDDGTYRWVGGRPGFETSQTSPK